MASRSHWLESGSRRSVKFRKAHSTQTAKGDYEDLHATVVDALRYQLDGEALDQAAHEVDRKSVV